MRTRAIILFLGLAAACTAETPRAPAVVPPAGLVVASFNFDESRVLAEIYAQALEDEGIRVQRELDLGPRELVLPAMRQGLVDVVPEYLGTLLDAATRAPGGDHGDPGFLRTQLGPILTGWGLQVLEPSPASNQNVLVVTRATADDRSLREVSDLGPIAADLTLGGPTECPVRRGCVPGLEATYSLRFAHFLALDGSRLVHQALLDGVIDVGVLFTTDGVLASNDIVGLVDDRRLQPAENIVPLVRTAAVQGRGVPAVLDEVSAELTTAEVRFLNWRVSVAGGTPAAEARGWLIRQGLVDRP
jgi:osmoprotectant transport system substrate-binding protein